MLSCWSFDMQLPGVPKSSSRNSWENWNDERRTTDNARGGGSTVGTPVGTTGGDSLKRGWKMMVQDLDVRKHPHLMIQRWGIFLNHGYPALLTSSWDMMLWVSVCYHFALLVLGRVIEAGAKMHDSIGQRKVALCRHQLIACGVSTSDQAHLPFWNHQ